MTFGFGPRRGAYLDATEVPPPPPAPPPAAAAAGARGAPPLRDARPRLPLAVRAALQLRPHLGPSRRLDLVGPVRRRAPLRRARLRPPAARPPRRRRRLP